MNAFSNEIKSLAYAADMERDLKRLALTAIALGLLLNALTIALLWESFGVLALMAGAAAFLLAPITLYALLVVTANKRTALMEDALPDFLGFMASNIRSGVTHDRALLLSARKEFGPLTREIDFAAKEVLAGKRLADALIDMTKKIRSEGIVKTIRLLVQGINSGGDLAELLETTSSDLRRFSSVRKDVNATLLLYQLFIFAAATFGAPLLYAVTNFLVTILFRIRTSASVEAAPEGLQTTSTLLGASLLSPDIVFWFSIAAIIITSVFAALAGGVIAKGKESEGYSSIPLFIALSLAVFFLTRAFLESMLSALLV